jgi:hypothetical protein
MQGEAQPSAPGVGRGVLDWYGPGKRELMVFVALVFLGFVVWFAGTPGSMPMVFGVGLPRWAQYDPPLSLLFAPVVCGALALAAGFVFDRGFYLWGIALGLHGPFVQGLTVHLMVQDGIELSGGRAGFVSYILISVMLLVFTVLLYTALSSMGAGARHLLGWMADR